VRGIALHAFDQIGDQIMALAQLRIDVGNALAHALAQADEIVVDPDHHHHQGNRHCNHHPDQPAHSYPLYLTPVIVVDTA
jgi:hypothetical protein